MPPTPSPEDGPKMTTRGGPLQAAPLPEFTRPTADRFAALPLAAAVTTGRRTVAGLPRTPGASRRATAPAAAASRPAPPGPARCRRPAEDDRERRRPHRTPARLACRLLRLVPSRIPGRRFVFAGGGGCGTHEAARLCRRRRARLTPVSEPRPDADPLEPPGPYQGGGRPRVEGRRLSILQLMRSLLSRHVHPIASLSSHNPVLRFLSRCASSASSS